MGALLLALAKSIYCTVPQEDVGTKLNCFGYENKNGGTFYGTFYSFHDELLSKNIARRKLDQQHLLFGVFADLNSPLPSKHPLSRRG